MLTNRPTQGVTLTLGMYMLALMTGSLPSPIVQAGNGVPSEGGPAPLARTIHLTHGQLTVTDPESSRLEVLQEIARQGAITLELKEPLRSQLAQERVGVTFHQLPLEEGLSRILLHQGFALVMASSQRLGSQWEWRALPAKTLWIVSRADGGALGANGYPQGDVSLSASPLAGYDAGTHTVSKFTELLTSEKARQREKAVKALGDTQDPEAVGPLTVALADKNRGVQEEAIKALGGIGGAESAQALGVVLQNQDSLLREAAIHALEAIGGEVAAQTLAIALQARNRGIRKEAVKALRKIRGETATRLLTQALADPDASVRRHASYGLQDLSIVND